MALNNKNIILGVCGSIAAYKSPDIVRRLKESGANVKVILTSGGANFITRMSLEAVGSEVFMEHNSADMPHIYLAKWADIVLIAPISANKVASINSGVGDDLLSLTILSTKAKIFIAPAMNKEMLANETTQQNLAHLEHKNITILPTGNGSQACGDEGLGRMLEPQQIVDFLLKSFNNNPLSSKKILITLGATIEKIDPVRYISNFSSGKMGVALANEAILRGLQTTIIYGNISVDLPGKSTNIKALSADEMLESVMQNIDNNDIFISVAAVSDYKIKNPSTQKIKKNTDNLTVELVKNPDILKTVANLKHKPFCVGFAAESQNLEQNAKTKLKNKNLDLIIANDVKDGFGSEKNKVLIIDKKQNSINIADEKSKIASQIFDVITQEINATNLL
jgi:phosphopantothenoylcysteine decarboxylase/phosphopantothenate--cysteine ligase